jgi:hypothetical protein
VGEERAAGDWSRSLEKRVADIGGGEGTCNLARRTRQRSVSAEPRALPLSDITYVAQQVVDRRPKPGVLIKDVE